MLSTSFVQVCLCGRSFDNAGAFTRHRKLCFQGKKCLANVLGHAKESYQSKKRRTESGSSSSNTISSKAGSHTVAESADDTVSHSFCVTDMTQPTQTTSLDDACVSGLDKVCIPFITLSYLTPLEPSDTVQTEDDTLPLSIRRARRTNR